MKRRERKNIIVVTLGDIISTGLAMLLFVIAVILTLCDWIAEIFKKFKKGK